ncbi:MAG: sigma-70 family RNA polymerase sigma factor [Bacteroidetes bacterium]|nr:sigma-70 family RNA polymerase sigma factor [Bacteroidota bacterium]
MKVQFRYTTARMNDSELIAHFQKNPEEAYAELLKRFSPVIIRMIRRFMYDQDEVMEVYTSVCERLRAKDFKALRRFRINKEITPWLSVVVANACRDRFRKNKYTSVPQSVISKLDAREKLVFKYYYQEQYQQDHIVEVIKGKHSMSCTALEVAHALDKIEGLLSINKRWHLIMALNQNKAMLSIEDLQEYGYEAASPDTAVAKVDPGEEKVNQLVAALEKLDAEDRLLVLLRFEQGMKASEIADALAFENHKYVYTRLRTIVNRLRRMMAEEMSN